MNTENHDQSSRKHDHHPDVEALLRKLPAEDAERLRDVWELAGPAEPIPAPSPEEVEKTLERLVARIEADERPASARETSRPARHPDRHARAPAARRSRWIGWAALAAVLLVGGLGLFWWLRPVTQVADPGERLTVTLPDGSRVDLNSGSRLRYAHRFDDVRTVHLVGEAYFEVEEQNRPFVVETFNARIRVLGTRFGVRAWPGSLEEGTTVALEAGRVTLAPAGHPDRAVAMEPGETRRVAADAAAATLQLLSGVTVDDATAWRRGDLVYKNRALGTVLDDVGRRYAVDIEVRPARLERKRLNLALRQPKSAEAVVRDLALALNLEYRETSSGFELFDSDAAPALDTPSIR